MLLLHAFQLGVVINGRGGAERAFRTPDRPRAAFCRLMEPGSSLPLVV
jgi:hypothetical protein